MNIIEANKDHIFIIKSLSDRIWPHTFAEMLSEDQIAYMMDMMYSQNSLEKQMDSGHQYLLAEENGEYLGYISYELNYQNTNITKVHKIYILPSLQGRGIGRFFIDVAIKIAKENNNTGLALNVNRDNTKAISFYELMGFSIAKREDNEIGCGYLMTDYVMHKIF